MNKQKHKNLVLSKQEKVTIINIIIITIIIIIITIITITNNIIIIIIKIFSTTHHTCEQWKPKTQYIWEVHPYYARIEKENWMAQRQPGYRTFNVLFLMIYNKKILSH